MQRYLIGDFIRELRMEMGYSQEELCEGICTPGNLSKIENNVRRPELNKLDAILQRLGRKEMFIGFADKEEMRLKLLIEELTIGIARHDTESIEMVLQMIEKNCTKRDSLSEQYVCFAQAILADFRGEDSRQILKELVRIFQMTKPRFTYGNKLPEGLYSYYEIVLVNAIAVKSFHLEQEQYAIYLLREIKKYMDNKVIDHQEKAKKYPLILTNLSAWLCNIGQYEEAMEICEEGLEICKKYGKIYPMVDMLIIQGTIYVNLFQIKRAKECFRNASHLLLILGETEENHIMCSQVKRNYGIRF